MYNDPNQPQQPPPFPSGGPGQPFYGQPQPQYPVPPVPSSVAPPPPKKSRRALWITLAIVVPLLLCGGGICAFVFGVFSFVSHTAAPSTDVVNHYYTAIKNQDYATAFTYIDPNVKNAQGQQVTSDLFTQVGQALDTQKGNVSGYSITNTAVNSTNGVNTTSFTVSVTRNGTAYDVHLQLQQEGNDWKITSYDNI